MSTKTLTGELYARMIKTGAAKLYQERTRINELNVFPIPDGDTGDNMYMTANGAAEAVSTEQAELEDVSSKVAKGMFMGARGNSGVILSRIFAGIGKGLTNIKDADLPLFSKAMEAGVNEAYSSVSHPVEGTILTVIREGVENTNKLLASSWTFETYFENLIREAKVSLDKTPELLPVLKEAGVVDSGAAGLICIFEGMYDALQGKTLQTSSSDGTNSTPDFSAFDENSELSFGYCTEFMLQLQTAKVGEVAAFDEKEILDYINSSGDSVVAFRNGNIIKVHVHTKTPGEILSHCQRWGEFVKVKIENMNLQHNETITAKKKVHKKFATVSVAAGSGIKKTFQELGTDCVIEGGQSMNPSVGDFIKAFDSLDADNIIVFPNNGNVILTARQAAEEYKKANIVVIPDHTVGEGYAAISMLDTSSNNVDLITSSINEVIQSTVTGMISKANRNTSQNGIEIKDGHYIGFDADDTIYTDNSDRMEAVRTLAEKLDAGSKDLLIVLRGKAVPEEEAKELASELQKKYKMTEIITIDGMQPVYDYILVLE